MPRPGWTPPPGMLRHAMQTLELSRAAGDRMPEIMSLNDVGYSHALLGHYRQARRAWARALRMFDELGHTDGDGSGPKCAGQATSLPCRPPAQPAAWPPRRCSSRPQGPFQRLQARWYPITGQGRAGSTTERRCHALTHRLPGRGYRGGGGVPYHRPGDAAAERAGRQAHGSAVGGQLQLRASALGARGEQPSLGPACPTWPRTSRNCGGPPLPPPNPSGWVSSPPARCPSPTRTRPGHPGSAV